MKTNILREILTNLKESMNTIIDYQFEEDNESILVKFQIDNDIIEIIFDKYDNIIDNFFEISFTRNNSLKLINKNINSFRILGIVKNIIFDFINKYEPYGFFYSIDNNSSSRLSLYTKLAKELSKTYILKDDIDLGKGNYTFLFANCIIKPY